MRNPQAIDIVEVPLFLPEAAASTYKTLFTGIDESGQEVEVQEAIKRVRQLATIS